VWPITATGRRGAAARAREEAIQERRVIDG
jgi:hypothetical protein